MFRIHIGLIAIPDPAVCADRNPDSAFVITRTVKFFHIFLLSIQISILPISERVISSQTYGIYIGCKKTFLKARDPDSTSVDPDPDEPTLK